ncbi:MAG: hypothetical protein ACKKL6_03970 [Candidatus Komeilibacteria bacterium]
MKLFISILLAMIIAIPAGAALINSDVLNPTEGSPIDSYSEFGTQSGFNTGDETPLPVRIGNFIQIILGFLGTVFLILIIISGFQWMMAGGNSEAIGKAKQRMINATIGLVIALAAYSITWFVTDQILISTGGGSLETQQVQ